LIFKSFSEKACRLRIFKSAFFLKEAFFYKAVKIDKLVKNQISGGKVKSSRSRRANGEE